ncbi:3-hydroxyacyl-CoA dehydrogenase [Mycena floridula]|nr:3-hydroxyacyl-CoA dehydrogenase [Mycena floridula]
MKVEDRTFVVSGGSSGLGLATVEELLRLDAYVSILDRSPPPETLPSARIRFFEVDITVNEQLEKAVESTLTWTRETDAILGGVVNCAGVGIAAKILDSQNEPHSLDLWNFSHCHDWLLKHLALVNPETDDGERGVVIFVSSAAAFEGQPGQTAYAATKGALRSMTLPMSRDLARYGIRVVTIAPGIFHSSMTANLPDKTAKSLESELIYPKRFGNPAEFAQTVKWILECAYVNGETIRLSGAGRMPGKL